MALFDLNDEFDDDVYDNMFQHNEEVPNHDTLLQISDDESNELHNIEGLNEISHEEANDYVEVNGNNEIHVEANPTNNNEGGDEIRHEDVNDETMPASEPRYVDEALRMLRGEIDMNLVKSPGKGMAFVSGEELAAFCYMYAHKEGFQLVISTSSFIDEYRLKGVRRNGVGEFEPRFFMMKRIRFICSKGTKLNNPRCEVVIDARIRDEKIVITQCKLEHNHDICPSRSRFMVGYRLMGDYFKRKALLYDDVGMPIARNYNTLVMEAGGHANLPFNGRDLRNMVNLKRRMGRIEGDAVALEDYFLKMKADNPDFYYAMEKDDNGVLINVFWADARCRAVCKVFGEVVSYDSTFLCNRYRMPFAPVIGVNHHGNTVVFATALISVEDADSHGWVFKKYLDCMGKPPSVMITDQCKAIGKAIRDIFPGTPHRLCLWHMLRNAVKHLGTHDRWDALHYKLCKVVHDSVDADDFEIHWWALVDEFGIRDNNWIKESYSIRESWVPLYWKDKFCAGMSSTQRSEQSNRFFKQYVNPETTLIKFMSQYELALKEFME